MKTYKVGRLYFKYIKNTILESQGWTADKLYSWMLERGYIAPTSDGRWMYTTGNNFSKKDLLKFLAVKDAA